MFPKAALLVAATMVALVASNPIPTQDGQCNGGNIHCCNEVIESQSDEGKFFASFIGLSVSDVTGKIGAQCSSITVVGGVGHGAECSQQTVCCKDNKFNGFVAVGCSPFKLL